MQEARDGQKVILTSHQMWMEVVGRERRPWAVDAARRGAAPYADAIG
jgi:hypothetical protein